MWLCPPSRCGTTRSVRPSWLASTGLMVVADSVESALTSRMLTIGVFDVDLTPKNHPIILRIPRTRCAGLVGLRLRLHIDADAPGITGLEVRAAGQGGGER